MKGNIITVCGVDGTVKTTIAKCICSILNLKNIANIYVGSIMANSKEKQILDMLVIYKNFSSDASKSMWEQTIGDYIFSLFIKNYFQLMLRLPSFVIVLFFLI